MSDCCDLNNEELVRLRGQFKHPIAVTVTDDGAIFVADYGNNRIQKWKKIIENSVKRIKR